MPELPEVETIRLGLRKYLVGHEIVDVDVSLPRIFSGDSKQIIGAKVQRIRRFGKGLLIDLDNDYSIAVHVKMTGQVLYRKVARASRVSQVPLAKVDVNDLPDKYTHIIFKLKSQNAKLKNASKNSKIDNDAFLFYRDMRQFGWVKVVLTKDAGDLAFFKNLGPEFFKDLDSKKFSEILKRNKKPVKQVIMDQSKMAGVGNIYANDGLYDAGINPKKAANSLTLKEQEKLFKSLEKVMKKGIAVGGASEWSYVDILGGAGQYQNFFQVYNQKGKPCNKCGSLIEKINLGGRGTFFCPACQK